MSDFLRELEEDIREERIINLWSKYGNYLIGLAIIIVLGTAASVLWQHMKAKSQMRNYASFSQALNLIKQGKKDEALKAFHDLAQEGGGYGKLAQLYEASLLANPEALYAQIAKTNIADPALGKLPKILNAARALNKSEGIGSIEALTAPNNAWAPLSLELFALENIKKGDSLGAAKFYIRILKEPSITPNEKLRASLMLSQLEVPSSMWEEVQRQEAQR